MASIRQRSLKSGKVSFTAQIVRRVANYHESRAFGKRKQAEAWAKKRESEIDADIKAGRRVQKRSNKRRTVGDAIDRYLQEHRRDMGKTKAQVLRTIRTEYDIADIQCAQITASDISSFANQVSDRPGVSSPATVNNYLQHLSAVFSVARPLWGFEIDDTAMKDSMKALAATGVRGKAESRDRRPTLDELDKLMSYFADASAHDPRCIPMHVVTAFAIFSTRRQAEICRITWADYEEGSKDHETRVMVRDLKHPGDKKGNDTYCTLPDPCRAIIAALPRRKVQILPYNPDTISRRFTNACKFLGIEDLHFHDLRHEGTSRLFEMDWNIPRAAKVTGHRSWMSLQRYEHIRARGDIYENWKWIAAVT